MKILTKFLNNLICIINGHSYQERIFEPKYKSEYNKDTKESIGFYCIRCGKIKGLRK